MTHNFVSKYLCAQTLQPDVTMTRQHFTRKQCRHSRMHAGTNQVWTVTMAFFSWQHSVVIEECIFSVQKALT